MLHLLIDGSGKPSAIATTSAKGNERLEVQQLLKQIAHLPKPSLEVTMSILEADRGCKFERAFPWLKRHFRRLLM